jgi:ABC-type branched-subunit amino acid transport system substrate-binding protein
MLRPIRASVLATAVIGLSLLATACSSSGTTAANGSTASGGSTGSGTASYPPIPAGPIKIGISASLTGPLAEEGALVKAEWEAAVLPTFYKLHPDGILGHKIQIDVENDASDTTTAVSVANKIVANKDAAVMTLTYNYTAAPLQMAIFMKGKVPVLATQGLSTFGDVSKYPYYFTTGVNDAVTGTAYANWLAKHPEIKSIGILGDGSLASTDEITTLESAIKAKGLPVKIGTSVQVSPGSVDVSAQVQQLKGAGVQAVAVFILGGHGPVWQGIQSANWSPVIMADAGAWYDGFNGMGTLAQKAVAPIDFCASSSSPKYSAQNIQGMNAYYAITKKNLVNYPLAYWTDSVPLEILLRAVEKVHTLDPDALKQALETMGTQSYLDGLGTTQYTPADHTALGGGAGPQICKMAPTVGGNFAVPQVAP